MSRRDAPFVLGLTLLGLALRVCAAWDMDVFHDEMLTIREAIRLNSLHELLTADPGNWMPPLSAATLRAWMALTGVSGRPSEAFLLRIPFVCASAVSIPLAWAAARSVLAPGRGTPLLVALAVAFHPMLLFYDREIRAYALVVPLALATFLFWLEAQKSEGRKGAWAGFAIFGALACWDHYNAIPFVAAFPALTVLERGRKGLLPAGLASLGVLLLYAPWLPGLYVHVTGSDLGAHTETLQCTVPPVVLTAPGYVLSSLVLGLSIFPWNPCVVPVALASAALTLAALARARATRSWRLPVLALAVPIAGVALTPIHLARYYVHCAPFLVLLLASGAEWTFARRPRLAVGLALAVGAGMAVSDVNFARGREYHRVYPLYPWLRIERTLRARPAPVITTVPRVFADFYIPDLAVRDGRAFLAGGPRDFWFLADDAMTEEEIRAWLALFAARGFLATHDEVFLRDPEFAARRRWFSGNFPEVRLRLVRFVRP